MWRKTERASIVNVSSAYAVAGRKGMGLYDATKAGMLAMTRTLACEEALHGVRVNAVCPGSTLRERKVVDRSHIQFLVCEVDSTPAEPVRKSFIAAWLGPDAQHNQH